MGSLMKSRTCPGTRHLNEATTKEEKQKMHTAKAFGLEALTMSDPPVQASGSSGHPPSTGGLESDSARRAATLRELAKRARESADSQRFVGRRKRAKIVQPEQVTTNLLSLQTTNLLSLQTTNLLSLQTTNILSFQTTNLLSLQTMNIHSSRQRTSSPSRRGTSSPPDDEPPLPPDDEPPLPPDDEPPLPPDHELPPIELILARRPRPNIDVDNLAQRAVLQKMKDSMEFVLALKNTSLDDPLAKLSNDALDRLRNPPQGPIIIDSPGVRQSISMYLALEHGSQEAYN
ncbi:hypothetical protein EDB19DRAFT_1910689 [Suillus lakei]|nr:hypothetical protein EDB19DRAFT_1910689 [Suillus lakei]